MNSKFQNLRVGLACPLNSSICVETTEVAITGQGVCVYNGERLPCTWYGFEFDYVRAQPGDEVLCVVTSNRSADFGDPSGVSREDANQFEYELPLESEAGHFFNPQYTIFEPNAPSRGTVLEETVCSIGKRELFRFQMEFQFPR
ncbi:MAG: hypothetical protein M0D54_19590 [Hyphomonadaceae bacterium JAD_PAG50586_4]|nr:MAG: hypothetical protein M0D54_19590 [Hyphomonadaceae bacterium JAD_PAG50586_4]